MSSVEQSVLAGLPHTALPARAIPHHRPSALPYPQRKSPFPEAITLAASGQDWTVTYGLGQGHAVQLVFVKQLRETHMAEQRELLVSGGWSCGWKLPVFSLPPL